MAALSDAELIRLGFGTRDNPHIAVHFDMFPRVYFTECPYRVGMTVDANGGRVFEDMTSAKNYALKQFDVLKNKELDKLEKFRHLIPIAEIAQFDEQSQGGW